MSHLLKKNLLHINTKKYFSWFYSKKQLFSPTMEKDIDFIVMLISAYKATCMSTISVF